MDKKLYSSTEQELVSDWADKWFELSNLINGLIWTDDPPWTTPPPTEVDELEYQRLRFWFIDRQEQFIPIWKDFYNCKKRVCTEGLIIENVKNFWIQMSLLRTIFIYSKELRICTGWPNSLSYKAE